MSIGGTIGKLLRNREKCRPNQWDLFRAALCSDCGLTAGGRGGIRTHGGLPHARFRVECLKPDSATLPFTSITRQNAVIMRRSGGFVNGAEPFRRLGMTELKMSQFKACQQAFSHCILYVRWTVPLLLVVRCNSQVISGAVHDYSPLFTT
jgi:hypothetical protein